MLGVALFIVMAAAAPPTAKAAIAEAAIAEAAIAEAAIAEAAIAEAAVDRVLTAFHAAAAQAAERPYFACLAETAVFMGTDATERWSKEEFRKYCKPYFDQGRGWQYEKKERHITLGPDGNTAWFDELLENKKNGLCRGSGVLVKQGDQWLIAQYNLSIPIPNEVLPKIKPLIDAAKK
jgi:hypothetical protein